MFKIIKKEIDWAGRKLTLETGRIARQSDGAVLVQYGNTVVLCTVVGQREIKEGADFFPLTVHYIEKAFAAGKIPGGFYKREGRPSEREILISRLIDRPIRPLFPEGFFNEVQVICTLLSYDMVNDPDILAIIGTSAALAISGIPFNGPIAATKIGYKEGEFVLNPTSEQFEGSKLDLVVAGTESSVLMVESEAHELSEEVMLNAVVFGHQNMQPIIDMIKEFAEESGVHRWEFAKPEHNALELLVKELAEHDLRDAYKERVKQVRYEKINNIKKRMVAKLVQDGYEELLINSVIGKLEEYIVRNDIIEKGVRIDGRDSKTVRVITSEVEILPKTHGSALFTRGETQALVVTTLGTAQDEQIIDSLEGDSREHFLLHYNFPPYSVGETTSLRSPGRREIGHGKLAWRAIRPVLPAKISFPYTIRVVSEITESNGSSSMATVCGASLALMDAGVPITRSVAGVAMGLIKEESNVVILSDIMGDEDHLGDMDFKVAGTEQGITALQMDIKIEGITTDIMQRALEQAKESRLLILDNMNTVITSHRETLNDNAPVITTITIAKDKIREVIGSGGSVVRKICDVTGAKIDINDDGTVKIAATNSKSGNAALKMIEDIAIDPVIGSIYTGKVVKVVDFGAFVNFVGTRDGLVHISELTDNELTNINEFIKEGDAVKVIVLDIDSRGKIKLSMRMVDQDTGEALYNIPRDEYNNNSYNSKKPSKSFQHKNTRPRDKENKGESRDKEKRKYYS
ncbi:Polyribonucleotide nucleotidyltransferase [Rickettsiales bacterium Ac37b]|nr:Polyribonucleotide nucleotidyltransferase [Rickettsiales bacterium Ac37b]